MNHDQREYSEMKWNQFSYWKMWRNENNSSIYSGNLFQVRLQTKHETEKSRIIPIVEYVLINSFNEKSQFKFR